jgi:DNA replication and repair protein RecF
MAGLVDFHRALKNKNAILRSGHADTKQLEVWDQIIAERSLELYGARQEFLLQLQERAEAYAEQFSPQDGPISLCLKSNIGNESHEQLSVAKILEKIKTAREREISNGVSSIGSHRDDVIIELGGKSAKAFASQGQARSVVLALKLAVIELIESRRNESPIVMLDDVESELDALRRAKLLELIFSKPRQVFLTGTQPPKELAGSQKDYRCLEVQAGAVTNLGSF